MTTFLISDLPADERPRERLERLGARALSVPELLAILLRTGVRGQSAAIVGARLLEHFDGSLPRLSSAPIGELCQFSGIGPAKAVTLAAAFELGRRLAQESLPEQVTVSSPSTVASYLRTRILNPNQEEFHVLLLNTQNRVIADECVTIGLMDRSLAHAREVFRTAIRIGCLRVVLAHNHPSGDPRPSKEDIALTTTLSAAGQLLDIRVMDHIILGSTEGDPLGKGYFSFVQSGLMDAPLQKRKSKMD